MGSTKFVEFTEKDRLDDIARILIEKGANVNVTNDEGDSAVILAATNSKNKTVRCVMHFDMKQSK